MSIRFVGHSTFLITSPDGVTIATDYNGYAGQGVIPRVVTMNRAHTSHFTEDPDPRIEYVLRGWNPEGGKAVHRLEVDDVLIRNVTTDIRGFGFDGDGSVRIPDGNSIFIFEVARLCIGHVGHLHHVLDAEDLDVIGQLDVVMVPVDGSMTMSQSAMVETLKVVKARLILPMHYFGVATLNRFLVNLDEEFDVELSRVPEIVSPSARCPRARRCWCCRVTETRQLSRRSARRPRPASGRSARRLRSARRSAPPPSASSAPRVGLRRRAHSSRRCEKSARA